MGLTIGAAARSREPHQGRGGSAMTGSAMTASAMTASAMTASAMTGDAIEAPCDVAAVGETMATAQAGRNRGHPVGAGTMLAPGQAEQARAAGAAFTVAPGFSPDVLAASTAAGLPHLPGAATATEVQRALPAGCHWLKAFPVSVLGPAWFREMRGPFPDVSFVATGGITGAMAGELLTAGVSAVGVGSAATSPGGLAELLAAVRDTAGATTEAVIRG